MKNKIVIFLFLILISFSMFGCSYDNSEEKVHKNMINIFDTIQTNDIDKVKELFSQSVIENNSTLTNDIEDLFEYYDGNWISIEKTSGLIVSDSNSYGKNVVVYDIPYLVSTDLEKYYVAVTWCEIDDNDSNNIGVHSLAILKSDNNPYTDYTYWGSGVREEGIIIDQPYVMTYIDSVATYIKNKDKSGFIDLFSKQTVKINEEFIKNMDKLFDIFDGNYDTNNCFAWRYFENDLAGYQVSAHLMDDNCEIIYSICLQIILESKDAGRLGVESLYFKTNSNTIDLNRPYLPDGFWANGINIEN